MKKSVIFLVLNRTTAIFAKSPILKKAPLIIVLVVQILVSSCSRKKEIQSKPNVIIVFTDDQGYQDLGCYGSPDISTPNIDKMAAEGLQYSNFYVASSVCSPSRAALLTGKLPKNNGVHHVYFQDENGMDTAQLTIAEVLKKANYKTACFGKWHLGDLKSSLPMAQGFDEYFGVPFSNDMSIGSTHEFAKDVSFNMGYDFEKAKKDQLLVEVDRQAGKKLWEQGKRNLVPLFEGNKIIEYPAEQSTLTKRYFNRAIRFIEQSKDSPFFIYLTPAMPHVPLYASDSFKGKSKRGLYGDVIEEIDHNMGQLLDYLKKSGLDKNTLVIYASDNGPWLEKGNDAGSAKPLRGGKFSNYEGGVRVPGIFWFPGKIKKHTSSNQLASTIDILPTVAALAKIDVSKAKTDGKILQEIIVTKTESSNINLYNKGAQVWGIRVGDWKFMPYSGNRKSNRNSNPELYNLKDDIGEQHNLIKELPEKAKEMEVLWKKWSKK